MSVTRLTAWPSPEEAQATPEPDARAAPAAAARPARKAKGAARQATKGKKGKKGGDQAAEQ